MSRAPSPQHAVARLRVRPDRVVYEITIALPRQRGARDDDVQQAFDRLSTLLAPVLEGATLVPTDYEPSPSSSSSPSAEDPQAAIDRMMLEMEEQLVQARQATATAIADERRLAKQLASEQELSEAWSQKATLAFKADHEELARQALQRKAEHDRLGARHAQQLTEQHTTVTTLKSTLQALHGKIEAVWTRRNHLLARARRAEAQLKVADAMRDIDNARGIEVMRQLERVISAVESRTDNDGGGGDDVTVEPARTSALSTVESRIHARWSVPLGAASSFFERSRLLGALDDALDAAASTFDRAPNSRATVSHTGPRFVVDDVQRHRAALVAACSNDVGASSVIAQTSIGLEEVELTLSSSIEAVAT